MAHNLVAGTLLELNWLCEGEEISGDCYGPGSGLSYLKVGSRKVCIPTHDAESNRGSSSTQVRRSLSRPKGTDLRSCVFFILTSYQ